MAQIAKASKSTEKKVAYQKKQEDNGKKVVNWIFGVLILLAIAFGQQLASGSIGVEPANSRSIERNPRGRGSRKIIFGHQFGKAR